MLSQTNPSPEPSARPLILIAEDEAIVARDIEHMLVDLGYEVIGRALNGEDAVRRAGARRPDLILMDIKMPGMMDGIDAATEIKKTGHVPVVFLSAYADDVTLERAKKTGPFGYVVKPFSPGALRSAIEVALSLSAEEAAGRNRDKLIAETLRSVADGVLTTDRDQRVRFLNASAEQMLGRHCDEVRGLPLSDVLHFDDGAAIDMLREIPSSRHSMTVHDASLVGCDGQSSIDVEVSVAPILTDDNAVVGGVLVLRNVSVEAKAERRERAADEKYRAIFEGANDAIWLFDLEGIVTAVNARGIERHGNLVGQHFLELVASNAALHRETFGEVVRGVSTVARGVEVRCSDGTRRFADFSATRVSLEGGDAILAIERDVTDERQMAEQLRQYQKIEALGQLTGGIAHDFNNILAVILSYSGFLAQDLSPDDPRSADVAEVQAAGKRGAALTRQLLAFSRNQVLNPEVVRIDSVVVALEKMLRRLIRADIALTVKGVADLGSVSADVGQIEQVLMNLVVNARDAMPNGGRIEIETANVDIDGKYASSHYPMVAGSFVSLSVSDTGCGMDADTLRRAFEPFFSTKPPGKGTGLGLSTVFGIVKQSGGFIWPYSEVGHGSVFKIYLPRLSTSATTFPRHDPAVDAPTALANAETILVVEDDAPVRQAMTRLLSARGYTLIAATSSEEALEMERAVVDDIDLVVTDIVMPGKDGVALLRELRSRRPSLKGLLVSGYTDIPMSLTEGLTDRAHFLQKPFTLAALEHRVRKILDEPRCSEGQGSRADGSPE